MCCLHHGYWHDCASLDCLASEVQPDFGSGAATRPLDEAHRHHALEALRQANFETVPDVLSGRGAPKPVHLLDVGCAHGWFLDAAKARSFIAEGLDPDSARTAVAWTKIHPMRPGGLLVLNLPSRRGALFRLASLVARTGLRGPLERLWQRGFPSPHRSYFSPDGLATLMAANGMQEVYLGTLPSVSRTGLWARLRYDNASSLPASIML